MDAVEVERDGDKLTINQSTDFVLEWVPLGESGDEVPDFLVVGMEDMGAIVMDADAIFVPMVIAVSSDMGTLVDDGDGMTCFCQ